MDFLKTDELGAVLQTLSVSSQEDEKVSPQDEKVTKKTDIEVIAPYHIPKDPSTISYGCLSDNLPDHGDEKYYITTAIAYTNGFPHVGHAYEALTTDIIARYHRVFGYDTFFLTGTDEHGQKVASSAEKLGRNPLEHCDIYANGFMALNQRLAVSNNEYIRTTSQKHEDSARVSVRTCIAWSNSIPFLIICVVL